MIICKIDEREFRGSALAIVQQLRERALFARGSSVSDYIAGCRRRIGMLVRDLPEPAAGASEEDEAESFLEALASVGLAEFMHVSAATAPVIPLFPKRAQLRAVPSGEPLKK